MVNRTGYLFGGSDLCIYWWLEGAAIANAFQTLVFMGMGIVAFYFVVQSLGRLEKAGSVPMRINEKGDVVQDYHFDKIFWPIDGS